MTRQGGPEVMELVDRPEPDPGPGEVLVEIAAAGVNFMDIGVRRGVVATRRLAKRQLTWLRALPGAHWVEPTDNSAVDFIVGLVKSSSNPNPA